MTVQEFEDFCCFSFDAIAKYSDVDRTTIFDDGIRNRHFWRCHQVAPPKMTMLQLIKLNSIQGHQKGLAL